MAAGYELEPADVPRDDLRWDDKLAQLQLEELDRVRATAEKWAASLGAIMGLAGTLVLVKGPEDISGLTSPLPAIVGGLIALAVITGGAAIYSAALAAQGTPTEVSYLSPSGLREWEHGQAVRSKDRLRCSRLLSFFVVGFIVAAIGLTWYGARKPSAAPSVLIIPTQGTASCGQLSHSQHGVAVKTKHGVAPIDSASAARLLVVTNCP